MIAAAALPELVQGGMGVGVSNWRLAAAVGAAGQLGVVSGTGLDTLFVRRLQDGDVGGHLRRATPRFPLPEVAAQVLARFFRPNGRRPGAAYAALARYNLTVSKLREQVTVFANFVEIALAREGHGGPIGINLLTKVQRPNFASLYGALLAGVDCVLMEAGIPRDNPRVLDDLAAQRATRLAHDIVGEAAGTTAIGFDPAALGFDSTRPLARPSFLPIVSSSPLAALLVRFLDGRDDYGARDVIAYLLAPGTRRTSRAPDERLHAGKTPNQVDA